ncbi:MAG TPA: efflux RND transporter permease subunit, partial [Afifellaceae bacterium]|nr:efflux RND transporter permease subunit [Afifellaceae bacterium]
SGLMGPYMSPIPANASAAMIFSFFFAVMVTPWLMLKIGAAGHHGEHAAEHASGRLGTLYAGVARPILAGKARSWAFLVIVGLLTVASLGLFYTKAVTVKLLPFDNKPELSVVADLPEGSSVEDTDRILSAIVDALSGSADIVSMQTYAGTAAPFNFNGLVRHYYLRSSPEMGEVQINLSGKAERSATSHELALRFREALKDLDLPEGTGLKVVEPPPGPPVLATLLAEIYGPDAETRRQIADKVRAAFMQVPFIVDVDNSYGRQAERIRITVSEDDLEFHKVEHRDVYATLQALYGGQTVGYSHRGGGRHPIVIRLVQAKSGRVIGQRALSTPVPANLIPGSRSIVELGDVTRVVREMASFPIFRHNGKPAERVTGELAGTFEAPLYGMIEVSRLVDEIDWGNLPRPRILLHGQPEDTNTPSLLWDGEWEVTWVTFRDMGAAFMVAIVGIYILVVIQFGSFTLPLVVLTPVPLTFIGIMLGHWLFGAPFSATSMIGFIALAGIIVRNSILLVDFIRHEAEPEKPLRDTLLKAGSIRFKPILLTAVAAMIGAAVILFDPIFQGLAISLLFGLASSTLLTVLVVPAIYVVLRSQRYPAREGET